MKNLDWILGSSNVYLDDEKVQQTQHINAKLNDRSGLITSEWQLSGVEQYGFL